MTRVVDVSNSASFEDVAVMKFFEASTRNLLAQEAAAGVRIQPLCQRKIWLRMNGCRSLKLLASVVSRRKQSDGSSGRDVFAHCA